MQQSMLVVFFTLAIILLMAGTFVFFYLRSLTQEITDNWQIIIKKLRNRLDKIPNLIETVRGFSNDQEVMINELIKLREVSWPKSEADSQKVQNELMITEKIHKLWGLGKKIPELGKSTNFLSLKMEFKRIGDEIEAGLETYNGKIRSYNKALDFIIIAPFKAIFGFKKLPIFEFEA